MCSARYSLYRPPLLWCFHKPPLEPAMVECVTVMSEGRLLWLNAVEWSLLLVSAALCGYLAVLI